MDTPTAPRPIGTWRQGSSPPQPLAAGLARSLLNVTHPIYVVAGRDGLCLAPDGTAQIGAAPGESSGALPLLAYVPPLPPEALGDAAFKARHGLRLAYVVGEMANGITSVEMVTAAGRAGMIGFFGAAGLLPAEVEAALARLQAEAAGVPFGVNLIHSPGNLELESALVELFLRRQMRLASASAFVDLTWPLVYYRVKGIRRDAHGRIVCANRLVAKASRVEVARKFLSPPPEKLLIRLVDRGLITAAEAALAAAVPMVDDLTAEADSGGHTDNRPAITLLPTMQALRDETAAAHGFAEPPAIGLGGGVATPAAAAAAFAMGAAYVVAGSIHQACVEAGTSRAVCTMLAEAGQADVAMAPAADMFEMGVKVQVLKRGTMFPHRAAKLYELYSAHESFEQIPPRQREIVERDILRRRFDQEWENTREFFRVRDPRQVERAERDPKHKMALVFRSYLGQSSSWAIAGEPERKLDYQIWCGPAMGAFNQWAKGSFLAKAENRRTVTVALNLLLGAAVATRAAWLRGQGIALPQSAGAMAPMELPEVLKHLGEGPS
ncbi:MAG: PfaD family polyunsaturated fatty acid/polyketide biosynthesis protein [Desulfobacterales bacterium]|jgi:PfaD family protein|nr:PfaD family polyunsaturated fatty acid/polyketide biosynthesis protein [Desulfobacterales bacterium]